MNYILVVDDERDIRDIYELVLKRAFPLDVVVAESGNKALNIIQERGRPEIIIADYWMPDGDGFFLYETMLKNKWNIPFVLSTGEDIELLKKKFLNIHGFIEKPQVVAPALRLVEAVVARHTDPPHFVPVRISLLLSSASSNYDLYMMLNEKKAVKVINEGEAFLPADAERFQKKGLEHLYITTADADAYLKSLEENISVLLKSSTLPANFTLVSLETVEAVERIGSSMGWTPEVLEAAKGAVNLAIKAVSANPDILKLFKQKLSNPSSKYSSHTSQLALLTCGIAYKLGWVSESTQMKLGLASLVHDLTVDEKVYEDINLWNEAACDPKSHTKEVTEYRNHPADAATLVVAMKNLPPDVDQIILQHHEANDGKGFPRGLFPNRISPLACVLIIAQELIIFMEESEKPEERVRMFLKYKEQAFSGGNFKKVFEGFKESVKDAGLSV